MSNLDLNKLENKLDAALQNETSESLIKWLNDKRMTNNKQIPTAQEFLNRDESGVFNEVDITQAMDEFAKLHVERIKQFLYAEICERRPYSASRMCEEVLKFIEDNEQQ